MILVTAGEMQEMDRQAIEAYGIPGLELMEKCFSTGSIRNGYD